MISIGLIVIVGWMFFIFVVGAGLFVWGIFTRQFKNVEEVKYTLLQDKEPEDWSEKGARKRGRV